MILIDQWLNTGETWGHGDRKCNNTCLCARVKIVEVGRRRWRLVRLRLRFDFVPRLLEVEVARLLSLGDCSRGRVGRGERRPRDDEGLARVKDNILKCDIFRCC